MPIDICPFTHKTTLFLMSALKVGNVGHFWQFTQLWFLCFTRPFCCYKLNHSSVYHFYAEIKINIACSYIKSTH